MASDPSTSSESDSTVVEPCEALKKDTVLFWIERSKNQNIVVYEATKKSESSAFWDSIDGYWLDIDPAYVKKARAKGKTDDRCELNYLEKSMAYGHTVKQSSQEGTFDVTLVSLPKQTLQMVNLPDQSPRLRTEIGGVKCYLRKVFVKTTDSWVGLPTVNYVDMFGYSVESGKLVTERITPSK